MLYNWYKIEELVATDLQELQMREVTVAKKNIGLLRKQGNIYAFAATCPHQSAKLCDGWIDAQGRIVCALHKYRFDPANGRNTSGEGYKLRTYPVEVRNGLIYVGLIL